MAQPIAFCEKLSCIMEISIHRVPKEANMEAMPRDGQKHLTVDQQQTIVVVYDSFRIALSS